ncbi:hypothetical protein CBR_g31042 [Chara braunii]|uniref:Reverse transcriptase n=1 Tax=Chara braunii TaxID=69332 RepID=A0A388LEE6_CHABU|nr:hypothetical protein CBR_g31042 [Chara braunii]|eukprot:GBG80582.1 hypothetical protein CBR_g31042 [Chara braunii]
MTTRGGRKALAQREEPVEAVRKAEPAQAAESAQVAELPPTHGLEQVEFRRIKGSDLQGPSSTLPEEREVVPLRTPLDSLETHLDASQWGASQLEADPDKPARYEPADEPSGPELEVEPHEPGKLRAEEVITVRDNTPPPTPIPEQVWEYWPQGIPEPDSEEIPAQQSETITPPLKQAEAEEQEEIEGARTHTVVVPQLAEPAAEHLDVEMPTFEGPPPEFPPAGEGVSVGVPLREAHETRAERPSRETTEEKFARVQEDERADEARETGDLGFSAARMAIERTDRRIHQVGTTSFQRYTMLRDELAASTMEVEQLSVQLVEERAKNQAWRSRMEAREAEWERRLQDMAAVVERLSTTKVVDWTEQSRYGIQGEEVRGLFGQGGTTGPPQQEGMKKVFLDPTKTKARRKAEEGSFSFKAPTKLASQQATPITIETPASEPAQRPQSPLVEGGPAEESPAILLEVRGGTFTGAVASAEPEAMEEEASHLDELVAAMKLDIPSGGSQGRKTPERVPKMGELKTRLGSWATEADSGGWASEQQQEVMSGPAAAVTPQPSEPHGDEGATRTEEVHEAMVQCTPAPSAVVGFLTSPSRFAPLATGVEFTHFIRQDDVTFFMVDVTDLLHYDPLCLDAELIPLEPDPPSISMALISTSVPPPSVESTPRSGADVDAEELARYTAHLEPAVRDLIREYHDVFPSSFLYAGIPPMRDVEHSIQLVPDYRVHHQAPYRLSIPKATELKRQLEELLRLGFIKPSNSSWGAPVLFARKADGTLRLCIDYRGLNRYTVKNSYPMPRSDELFDRLAGNRFFTKIDLRSVYHQIRVAAADQQKTAFRSHFGHYEFIVMPFGLTNAPATFQRAMNDIFRDILEQYVLVYLDDILVYSRTLEEHLRHLRDVLDRLRRHGFYAKLSKCRFAQHKVDFLGHYVSDQGLHMDDAKITAIAEWPAPTSAKQLRSFLGLTSYYNNFIRGYARYSYGTREPRICVPSIGQPRVRAVAEFHNQAVAGHMGFHKTLARVSRLYVWPKRKDFVKDYVAESPTCQEVNSANHLPYGLLQPLPIPEGRWQSISMDFIGPLRPPTPHGHDAILVVVDRFTKRARFVPCRYAISAREVADIVFDRVVRDHGLPLSIISDRDPRFTSRFWRRLHEVYGTQLRFSSSYHPQTDGQTEITNRTLEDILRKIVRNDQQWDLHLAHAEIAYNHAVSPAMGMSPYYCDLGYHPRVPADFLRPSQMHPDTSCPALDDWVAHMTSIMKTAHEHIAASQTRMAARANRSRMDHPFKVGDDVLIDARHLQLEADTLCKFRRHFFGPCRIL